MFTVHDSQFVPAKSGKTEPVICPADESILCRISNAQKGLEESAWFLCCPAVFGHCSPAPVKTDRAVWIQ